MASGADRAGIAAPVWIGIGDGLYAAVLEPEHALRRRGHLRAMSNDDTSQLHGADGRIDRGFVRCIEMTRRLNLSAFLWARAVCTFHLVCRAADWARESGHDQT